MKIDIENLKWMMNGKSITGYQRGLAWSEFERLLSYVEKLEQAPKGMSAMAFCSKAEAFIAWLDKVELDSFYRDGKLIYYSVNQNSTELSAEQVLAMFEEEKTHYYKD
ncbi:MAG TPA: hypothetical protein PLN38_08285 [Chitinophagales bacterium]|nr:hypothetical protein [Chitinophagales bacterium]